MAGVGEESRPIVIDNGTGTIRAGFAGDDKPKVTMSNLYGRLQDVPKPRLGAKGEFLDYETESDLGTYPMQRGVIQDWEKMEKMLLDAFRKLLISNSSECPVIITERPLSSKAQREKMTQILFETFEVPSAYIANQATMALYSCTEHGTGIVLDSGHGVTHAVPVYEYCPLPHAIQQSEFGGHDVTLFLQQLLQEKGCKLQSRSSVAAVDNMKHSLCYVSQNFDKELEKTSKSAKMEKVYDLGHGEVVSLNEEMFQAPQSLFSPCITGRDSLPSLPEMIQQCIMKTNAEVRKEVHSNIVICGGNTLFSGFSERMALEMKTGNLPDLAGESNILIPPDRDISVWKGASRYAVEFVSDSYVRKKEYDEAGPSAIHRKCF